MAPNQHKPQQYYGQYNTSPQTQQQQQQLYNVAPTPPQQPQYYGGDLLPPPTTGGLAPQPYPLSSPSDPRQALDRSTDACARVGGLILVALAVTGFTFCVLATTSCNFLSVVIPNQLFQEMSNDTNATLPPLIEDNRRVENQEMWQDSMDGNERQLQLFDGNDTVLPFVPSNEPSLAPSASPTSIGDTFVTWTFGLFVYQDPFSAYTNDPFNEPVCSFYTYDTVNNNQPSSATELPLYFRLARLGVTIALIGSGIATFIIVLEFFLTRVWCSRVLINLGLGAAILSIPLTFVLFADSRCNPLTVKSYNQESVVGGCDLGSGAEEALIAGTLFLVTFILACVIPKPLPLVRVIREMQDNQRFACCCLCFDLLNCDRCCPKAICCQRQIRGRNGKGYDNDDIMSNDGGMEMTVPLSFVENVLDQQGHSYKQYHDETAGYTLQNQYTASYRRWLAFEEDYEEALSRFKVECEDAGVNWRKFLRRARRQRLQRDQQSCGASHSLSDENIPDDEDNDLYNDDELMRLVQLLLALRENCTFAKEIMARIQNDINELTRLEDERHKASTIPTINPDISTASVAPGDPVPAENQSDGTHQAMPSQPKIEVRYPNGNGTAGNTVQESFAYFSTKSSDGFEMPLLNGNETQSDFVSQLSDVSHDRAEDVSKKNAEQGFSPFATDTNDTVQSTPKRGKMDQKERNGHIVPKRVREGIMIGEELQKIHWSDWKRPFQKQKREKEATCTEV